MFIRFIRPDKYEILQKQGAITDMPGFGLEYIQ
jgi:hypothetical protein